MEPVLLLSVPPAPVGPCTAYRKPPSVLCVDIRECGSALGLGKERVVPLLGVAEQSNAASLRAEVGDPGCKVRARNHRGNTGSESRGGYCRRRIVALIPAFS